MGKMEATAFSPKRVFVPTSPWSGKKVPNMQIGFKWLIQWDYIIGTVGTTVWAITLYLHAAWSQDIDIDINSMAFMVFRYSVIGGPMGMPIGLMWERDLIVFGR